ncbi:MAG: hypothetical protein Q9168_002467 [Polycauliona sp. 1 TL-2023]
MSNSAVPSLAPSLMDDEPYPNMLYRLCRRHLPPGYLPSPSPITEPPPNMCVSPSCPVQATHVKGLFINNGVPNPWQFEDYDFGASNPPENVWLARHQIVHATGSRADYHLVHAFIHYHYVAREEPQDDDDDEAANMMELTDEVAGLDIHASNPENATSHQQQDAGASPPDNRTESEKDAELDRDLADAYYEMELDDAAQQTAQMNLDDGTAETGVAPQAAEETQPQPADGALRELVEVAYRTCTADADLDPEYGDDDIL